jgi:transaldolase
MDIGSVTPLSSDGAQAELGMVPRAKRQGRGPAIWLAGDPEDLKEWMPLGIAGIVTNTVVLNQMVKKYGPMIDVVKRYLDITDKPLVVEIDGHTTEELLEVGRVFTRMSDQVILKVPCGVTGLKVFPFLREEGVETFCTTVFSLPQAAAVAQAGANHLLPFCEPVKEVGGDPTKLIRDCVKMFAGWEQRPYIMAALVRSVDVAYAAFRDGADELVTMWTVYRDMMEHPLTEQWNQTFMSEWVAMHEAGMLEGVPVRLGQSE